MLRSGMRIFGLLIAASIAAPAHAAAVSVPEPSSLALFGLGVLGVIVGRQGSRGKRKD